MSTTETNTILTVSQVAAQIDRALRSLGDAWFEGEVRELNVHLRSGHCYLKLADEDAELAACIWKGRLAQCQPLPKAGELVQAISSASASTRPTGRRA